MSPTSRFFSVRSIAAFGCFTIALAVNGRTQTPAPVHDPSNPVPHHLRWGAEARANHTPSSQGSRHKDRNGAVSSGRRRLEGLNKEDLKRIKALLTPDRADVERYREFLKQDDTGIFRLFPDFDCVSKRTISVSGNCANQVYRGSIFTFRGRSRFSDLRYNNGRLAGSGFFSHEILVDLGDVPIDDLKLDSRGVEFLNAYAPSNEFSEANKQFREIASGIDFDGMTFSRSVVPHADRTYAVRIVAFDNGNSIQTRLWGRERPEPLIRPFHALLWDKRVDIIVVFRVIRLEEDGNITIIWKQLSRKKAPEITFEDSEALQNFK